MGTIAAQDIADKAWIVLQDTAGGGGVRWPASEVLGWINDGQREIVMLQPFANTKAAKVAPADDTRQTLAGLGLADGIQVLKVPRNFGADGSTPGRAIEKTSIAYLDAHRPMWHGETGTAAVHFMTDPQEPGTFHLWPRVSGGKKVEVIYSAVPDEVPTIADTITLGDVYANAIGYYLLFRALSKRATNATANGQAAAGYYSLMLQVLGVREKVVVGSDQAQSARGQEA